MSLHELYNSGLDFSGHHITWREIVGNAFAKLDPIALHTVLLLVRKRRENLAETIVDAFTSAL